ncbi:hypothetical protein M452_0209290 [Staphylococcus epidermidis APO35]|nr:hypothetical protein M452_0209290 [Staphylococcus epidermidis APO35]ESV14840.1 hypothetical protein M463_0207485 [Staphylococcus epidermidis WI05]ESV19283.1 hypothetical protein M464_0205365 [Staphylococcus epidermidis WI09]ESV24596.1 hypothetical protein M453_0207380 [Staphylococcus epidermidis CIM40]ESV28902.1 hypothetical protein M451_0210075 [Staphylococcus epidermidis APO27]ESV43336.1 hypothetical protein M455_0204215 [Staphylococcus epidermidis MC19]
MNNEWTDFYFFRNLLIYMLIIDYKMVREIKNVIKQSPSLLLLKQKFYNTNHVIAFMY